MPAYSCKNPVELKNEYSELTARYESLKGENLKLDMSRGKPSKLQLDLVSDILTVLVDPSLCIDNGVDSRNYGELAGLQCAKAYWADVLGCKPSQTFVGGNASLTLMYDVISKACTHGLKDSPRPWCKDIQVCPTLRF